MACWLVENTRHRGVTGKASAMALLMSYGSADHGDSELSSLRIVRNLLHVPSDRSPMSADTRKVYEQLCEQPQITAEWTFSTEQICDMGKRAPRG